MNHEIIKNVIALAEYEKMLAGKIYSPVDLKANKLGHDQHNLTLEYNKLYDTDYKRKELVDKIFSKHRGSIYIH